MLRFLFVSFFLLAFSGTANARSCVTPENGVKESDVVFKGRALSIVTQDWKLTNEDERQLQIVSGVERAAYMKYWLGKKLTIKFHVIEAYKGVEGSEVEIVDGTGGVSSSGADYRIGKIYVVYADRSRDGFNSPSCGMGVVLDHPVDSHDKYGAQLAVFKAQSGVFKKLVAEYPDNAEIYRYQAIFDEDYKDYAAAEKAYSTGLSLSAESWRFLLGYGRVLFLQGKYKEALPALEKLKNHKEAHQMYVQALAKLGESGGKAAPVVEEGR
ncbi:MAG: tetratricopeptide repeat protein [Alphaproteobacteria bacterium]|nr:tetratricopeptide repeat protein [Alphaproteobacteria bacterium]